MNKYKLIIAEKPSVMRDISRVIGAVEEVRETDSTYYKNDEYIVTSALGHLVKLAIPNVYNSTWKPPCKTEVLPMFPQNWILEPVPNMEKKLNSLIKLINRNDVESLICGTDSGREGELIFRYIYNYSKCNKPFKRLWISSLTDESIENGIKNLIDGKEKNNLYEAAFTRSRVDWLYGMNFSTLFSSLYKKSFSVGRVRTPTINMIVQRDNEIENFSKKKYYSLELENGAEYFCEKDEEMSLFSDKLKAEVIRQDCVGKTAKVTSALSQQKSENRPLLYSLTSLQKDANERHGFTAARTLVTMQELYEKKLFSYPRTDSNHITDDMKNDVEIIVKKLSHHAPKQVDKLMRQGLNLDKRMVDNSKVTDHTAIIPTKEIDKIDFSRLSPDQKIIAELIIERLLITLDLPYVYEETKCIFNIETHTFKLITKKTVSMGFKDYSNPDYSEKNKSNNLYKHGDNFMVKDVKIIEKETSPPKPFTESTLLSAMENIANRIEGKEMKAMVRERGLGTPATRAGIIEEIIRRGYVQREKKNIVSTLAGRKYVESLPEDIKSVELTGNMECLISNIEKGIVSPNRALSEVERFISDIIESEKKKEPIDLGSENLDPLGECPKCKKRVVEKKLTFSCENAMECGFVMWKNDKFWESKKKNLTAALVKKILKNGKCLVKGLYSEGKDKTYDAYISLGEWIGKDGKARVNYNMEFVRK